MDSLRGDLFRAWHRVYDGGLGRVRTLAPYLCINGLEAGLSYGRLRWLTEGSVDVYGCSKKESLGWNEEARCVWDFTNDDQPTIKHREHNCAG
jgi:hypothetical protein